MSEKHEVCYPPPSDPLSPFFLLRFRLSLSTIFFFDIEFRERGDMVIRDVLTQDSKFACRRPGRPNWPETFLGNRLQQANYINHLTTSTQAVDGFAECIQHTSPQHTTYNLQPSHRAIGTRELVAFFFHYQGNVLLRYVRGVETTLYR